MEIKDYNETSFSFWKMPKFLLTDDYFKDLSMGGVILFSLLIDAYKLSKDNDWKDENGQHYVKFSIERVKNLLKCTHPTAIKTLRELEGFGLIKIKKQAPGKVNLIYVKDLEELACFEKSTSKNSLEEKEDKYLNSFSRGVKNLSSKPVKNLSHNKNIYNKTYNNKNMSSPIPYDSIIFYLNKRANKSYKVTSKKTRNLINSRWKEGFKLDDFKEVIDNKTTQWLCNDKMKTYLRPSTLFGTKFEDYVNESPSTNSKVYKSRISPRKIEYKQNFAIDQMLEKLDKMGACL